MSQAVAIYTLFAVDVLLICWLGTQLTQHVRDNYLFYSGDVTYIRNAEEYQGIRKSVSNWTVSIFLYYSASYNDFFVRI